MQEQVIYRLSNSLSSMDCQRMTSLIIGFLLLSQTVVAMNDQRNKTIFILAGQSNMAGRGGNTATPWPNHWDGVVPPECQPNPQILRLNAGLKWEEAHEPLHVDIDIGIGKVCGIGPGMPFANKLLAKNSAIGTIGLVPCAIGGTSLEQWSKGTDLYTKMMNRTRAALKDGGAIGALLWYQGEADSYDLSTATTYTTRFERFINDVRTDLQLPNLPVVQVAIATGGNYKAEERHSQLAVNLPNLITIDAVRQPIQGDKMHLTTEGEIHVGHMFADAFLKLCASQ